MLVSTALLLTVASALLLGILCAYAALAALLRAFRRHPQPRSAPAGVAAEALLAKAEAAGD